MFRFLKLLGAGVIIAAVGGAAFVVSALGSLFSMIIGTAAVIIMFVAEAIRKDDK